MSNYDYQCSLPPFKEPKDQSRQKVFIAIQKLQPCTNQQIAKYLGWEINKITGRTRELVERKLVECAFKQPDMESGRTVNFWKTVNICTKDEWEKGATYKFPDKLLNVEIIEP